MKKMLGTTFEKPCPESPSSPIETRIVLEERFITDGDRITFGTNTLRFIHEPDEAKTKRDADKKIQIWKNSLLLPKKTCLTGDLFINEKDGGKYYGISIDGRESFVKFRTLKTGKLPVSDRQYSTIVTSQCIFGVNGVQAVSENGQVTSMTQSGAIFDQKIVDIVTEPRLSAYELEAIYRVISFINTLVGEDTNYKKVVLTTPRTSYYLYALDIYERGLLPRELMLKWFDAVDSRSTRINQLVSKRLNKRLSVAIRSPLEGLRDYVRRSVQNGSIPRLLEGISLLEERDACYGELFRVSKPASWLDLSDNMGISIEELRPSLETGEGSVIVKSPKQESTFLRSESLVKRLARHGHAFDLHAMYPHEQVIVSHDTPKKASLYHIPEPIALSGTKDLIRKYGFLSIAR